MMRRDAPSPGRPPGGQAMPTALLLAVLSTGPLVTAQTEGPVTYRGTPPTPGAVPMLLPVGPVPPPPPPSQEARPQQPAIRPAPALAPAPVSPHPQQAPQPPQPTAPAQLPALTPTPAAAPPAPLVEKLAPLDPQKSEVSWNGHNWQLVADGKVLRDFGRREADAREALWAVRGLNLTQHGTLGAGLEYWLSDGHAPAGHVAGLRPLSIDLPTLRVEQTQGQWCLRDRQRVLFNFGLRDDDARTALAVIRKYGFSQVATIGQGAPEMVVFLGGARDQSVLGGLSAAPAGPATPALHPPTPPAPASPAAQAAARQAAATPDLPVTAAVPGLQPSALATDDRPGAAHALTPFGPAAAGAGPVERLAFDWRQVQMRHEADGWKVCNGGQELARFGDEQAARQAVNVVQRYRLTERCHIGTGGGCTLFLSNGVAPRGSAFGLPGEPFNPNGL